MISESGCWPLIPTQRKRLKPEYLTSEPKEVIAVYYFEQKKDMMS